MSTAAIRDEKGWFGAWPGGPWAGFLGAWFVLITFVTWAAFRWQIEYFRTPGEAFYYGILAAIPLAIGGSLLYACFRGDTLIRWEPWLAASPLLIVILREPWGSLAAVALMGSAMVVGRWSLMRLGLLGRDGPQEWMLSLAAGAAIVGWALSLAAMAGMMTRPLLWAVALVPCVLGLRGVSRPLEDVRVAWQDWGSDPDVRSSMTGLLVPFLGILLLSAAFVAAAPAVAHDAVNFHLPLAQKWNDTGSLTPSFEHVYSFFPQLFEVLMAWAYALGGAAAARVFCFGLTLVGLALCWRITRLLGGGRSAGVAALAIIGAAPAVHWMGAVLKNDFLMATMQIACLVCFLRWRGEGNYRWVLVGCWFFGCSFGVKHSAVFAALAIGLLSLQALWAQPSRLKALAAVAVIFAATASIWHVRTYWLAGDPAYPASSQLALRVLDTPETTARIAPIKRPARTISQMHGHAGVYQFENVLTAPLGVMNSLLFPLLLMLPFRGRGTLRSPVGFAMAVSLSYWAFTIGNVRYGVTALLLLALLLGLALSHAHRAATPRARTMLMAAVLYGLVFGWTGILIIENSGPQLRYLAGLASEEEYVETVYPFSPAIEAVNAMAGSEDEVLAVGCCAPMLFQTGWKFNCAETTEKDPTSTVAKAMASRWSYSYLIGPNWMTPERLGVEGLSEKVYEDNNCTVHRLPGSRSE